MSTDCDVIVIFPIYDQFEANAQSVKLTFSLTKTENRTKKLLTQFSGYCFA